MDSFTQAQIAKKHDIARSTVNRWIELAIAKKNNLQLDFANGKTKIIDNLNNESEILRLVSEGKVYKTQNSKKITALDIKFKEIFNEEEVIEIINDLKFKRQFKTKFSYKNPKFWDEYYQEFDSPLKSSTTQLMSNSLVDILELLDNPKKINVIDIGPGNGFPIKSTLDSLINLELLNRYVAVDISNEMNEIATKNIEKWFPNIETRTYEKDIESSKFGKIFLENKSLLSNCSNLIFHIGNTICNHDDRIQILKNLKSGMLSNDLLIFTFTLDKSINRSQLNYIKASNGDVMQYWPLEMFGIDLKNCTIETEFDSVKNCKSKSLFLDKDYTVNFELFDKKETIQLQKNEKINIWRHYLIGIEKLIHELKVSELEMVNFKIDKTFSYALAICKIVTN